MTLNDHLILLPLFNERRTPHFRNMIHHVILHAEEIAQVQLKTNDLHEWQLGLGERLTREFHSKSGHLHALMGIGLTIVGRAKIGTPQYQLGFKFGAQGQRHLTLALLRLQSEERAVLLQAAGPVRSCVRGAATVAGVVTSLAHEQVQSLQPTVSQDFREGIDLLVVASRRACLQVKQGGTASLLTEPRCDARLLEAAKHISSRTKGHWRALAVTADPSDEVNMETPSTKEAAKLIARAIS